MDCRHDFVIGEPVVKGKSTVIISIATKLLSNLHDVREEMLEVGFVIGIRRQLERCDVLEEIRKENSPRHVSEIGVAMGTRSVFDKCLKDDDVATVTTCLRAIVVSRSR